MKIGIDIDDTIVNTKELQIKLWKEYIKNNKNNKYTKDLPSNINEFGDPYINTFWDTYREQLSFSTTIKEGAKEVIKKLQEEGYKLCIITSRPEDKYTNLKQRIKEHLSKYDIYIDEIITDAKDKGSSMVKNNVDILIDDDIRHINSALKYNKTAIHLNDSTSWKDIEKHIRNI